MSSRDITSLRETEHVNRWVTIGVYVLGLGVPISVRAILNAPISIATLTFFSLLIVSLGLAGRVYRKNSPWITYVSSAVNAVFGILVLIGILITPLSAYRVWFDAFRLGSPDGEISSLFVVIAGYFSSILSPMMVSMGPLWPIIAVVFSILYILAVVIQTQIYLYLVLIFLIVPMAYLAFRSASRGRPERAVIFPIGLVAVAFVVAVAIPKFGTPPGNEYINDRLYPNLRAAVVAAAPRFPMLFAVPGYGIRFDEKQLGGTPTLLPNPIFHVSGKANEVLYLKTRVFDTYDGSSWAMSPHFEGRSTNPRRSRHFGAVEDVRPDDLRIALTAKTFGFIPYTLDTEQIVISKGPPRIAKGSIDTGFQLQEPLREDDVVYLRRNDHAATTPMSDIERGLYLQIPGDLPPELRIIADGLSAGNDDSEQILANIEDFLAQNYTYNLDIPEVFDEFITGIPESDFVYSFLFSSSGGYCVQFATSFIILARLNDIPARYTTGYLSYLPSDSDEGDVTGLSAHAWPEVWVDGQGWVNWEATPAANIANYSNIGDNWVFNLGVDLNDTTSRQMENLLGTRITGLDVQGGPKSRIWQIVLLAFAGTAAAAGVAFGSVLLVRGAQHLFRDDDGKFFAAARRLSVSLDRRGLSRPENVGWMAWFDEVDAHLPESVEGVAGMRNLMMRLTYTDDDVTPAHLTSMSLFSRYVRRQLRDSNGDGVN